MLYVFIGCLAFGVFYSIISAIFGGHGFDHGGLDHGGFDHGGLDHGGLDQTALDHGGSGQLEADSSTDSAGTPSPFNPLVIASAITAFGAVGLIADAGFGMGGILSTVVALGFAGVIGALMFFGIVKFMYNSQSNSVFSLNDLIDTEAEVTIPIPGNGTGEIAYVINGIRDTLSARSSQHEEIARGTAVIIRQIAANAAVVQKKITLDDIEAFESEGEKPRMNNEN